MVWAAAAALAVAITGCERSGVVADRPPAARPTVLSSASDPPSKLSGDALLDEIQRRCLRYFIEQADPDTGLIADRAAADGSNRPDMGSTAATGFGLAVLCIADEKGWVEHDAAYAQVVRTLRYLWHDLPHHHGWYHHFIDIRDGSRAWNSEVSSIDTALLLCGVLTARQAYPDTEAAELATKIYERMDFAWITEGRATMGMGWKPESGFLVQHWEDYAEFMVLSLLALGSPTHALPPSSWHAWKRSEVFTYRGRTFIGSPSLFTHQYSHAFVNFEGLRDDYADYWLNSRLVTLAQREMCATQLKPRFPHFGENVWGISSSEYARGYTGWGGPPATTNIDGTVVPYAVAGSLVFAPEECLATLRHFADEYEELFWTHYGPSAAFNPGTGWRAEDVLAIDQGITFIMIENLRTGRPWELFTANPEIGRAMDLAGFRPLTDAEATADRDNSLFVTTDNLPIPAEVLTDARWAPHDADALPLDTGWEGADWKELRVDNAWQWGQPTKRHNVTGRFAFLWDDAALHVRVRVVDDDVSNQQVPEKLHLEDSVEVLFDPHGDGFAWKDLYDFRIGFSPAGQRYEWFGQRDDYESQIVKTDDGYEVRASFPWAMLKVKPEAGRTVGATVGIKSVHPEDGLLRLIWCFMGKKPPIGLGSVHLR